MTDDTATTWLCPKDGTAMQPMGRRGRGGAWRCPACRGMFIDVEAMRRGRRDGPPKWAPVVVNALVGLVAVIVIRRLRRRRRERLQTLGR